MACHIGEWHGLWIRWSLSAMAVAMGLAAAGGGALILLDYLALAPGLSGQGLATTRSLAVKGMALAWLAALVMLPLGFYGMFGIRRKASDDTNL
jgi:hypothetical protein